MSDDSVNVNHATTSPAMNRMESTIGRLSVIEAGLKGVGMDISLVKEALAPSVCDCPMAGYCVRYRRLMVGRLHQICQGDSGLGAEKEAKYRSRWLEQRDDLSVPFDLPIFPRFRLGDSVACLIKICTFGLAKPNKGCGCAARQGKLNALGDRLLTWFRRKHPPDPQRVSDCQQKQAQLEASLAASVQQATEL